jgi:hypothetical protein
MGAAMTLPDIAQRKQVLTDLGTTLLVEAAAGTGKTSLMASRVAMLLASGADPKHVAAITFTEPAAAELALRIRDTIDALLAGQIPNVLKPVLPNGLSDAQRAALITATQNLDELTATTIHGFCLTIIRSHAVAAGLDPGSKVMDAATADAMFDSVFARWLTERLSGAGGAGADDAIAVLSQDDPLNIAERLRQLAILRRKHPTAPAGDADRPPRYRVHRCRAGVCALVCRQPRRWANRRARNGPRDARSFLYRRACRRAALCGALAAGVAADSRLDAPQCSGI